MSRFEPGGACNAFTWRGEIDWRKVAGKDAGLALCYVEGNEAVIVWTRYRAGQRDSANILGVARAPAREQPGLYEWWSTWREDIGKAAA